MFLTAHTSIYDVIRKHSHRRRWRNLIGIPLVKERLEFGFDVPAIENS